LKKECISLNDKIPSLKAEKLKQKKRVDEHGSIKDLDNEDCQKIEEQIKAINTKLREIDNNFKAKYGSYVAFTDSVDMADNYFATFSYLETEVPVIFKNNQRSTEQLNEFIACCKEGIFQNNNYEESYYDEEME
jgi:hypothetical protein